MLRSAAVLLAAATPFALTSAAHASVVDLSAFSGSETVIDFTGVSVPLTSDPITVGDLTIQPDIFGVWPATPEASGGDDLSNWNTTAMNMTLEFANPINRVGMWIKGGNAATSWTFTAFDAVGAAVGSHVFGFVLDDGFPDPSTFAGVEFATALASLTIVETNNNGQYTNIDDIRFETTAVVRLPVSVLLLVGGIGALGAFGCRKTRAS